MRLNPSREAMLELFERQGEMLDRMVHDYRSGQHQSLPWKLVPASNLARIWKAAAAEGFVRDAKGLERIEALMIENVLKLSVNNDISGHSHVEPTDVLSDHFREDEIEAFVEWAIECPGGWRISDYGIEDLFKLAALATETRDPLEKLAVLDRMLNVCHQRSDLAGWFVEGGSRMLSELSAGERPGSDDGDTSLTP